MKAIWGARSLAVVAEKKELRIVTSDGSSSTVTADRDHASKGWQHIAFHSSQPYFAVTSKGGNLSIYDVRTRKVFQRFQAGDECVGVGFSANSVIVATRTKGEVIEWNIESGDEIQRYVADEEGLSAICVFESSDEEAASLVATARTSISVWQAGKRSCKLSGHASNVHRMSFLRDGTLATLASDERSINIWPTNVKKAKSPLMQLNAPFALNWMNTGAPWKDEDSASLLAGNASESKGFLWRIPSSRESNGVLSLSPVSTIESESGKGLFMCDFSKQSGSLICLIQQSGDMKPVLVEKSALSPTGEAGISGKIIVEAESKKQESASALNSANSSGEPTSLKRLDRSAVVNQGDPKRARAPSMTSQGEDDRPMMARLAEFADRMDVSSSSALSESVSRLNAPSSLTVALDQALQAADKEKIEAVLQTTDLSIVSQTISRLSPLKVPVLVRELAIRLQGKPGRAGHLLVWVNSILEHHHVTLNSDPAARDALRQVYSIADSRVQTFDSLLRLKGRLDLLLARAVPAGHGGAEDAKGPLLVVDGTKM